MINEIDLQDLILLGKEKDGSFSDGYSVIIRPNHKKTKWDFIIFDEIYGLEEFLCEIKNIEHLKELYFNLFLKELY